MCSICNGFALRQSAKRAVAVDGPQQPIGRVFCAVEKEGVPHGKDWNSLAKCRLPQTAVVLIGVADQRRCRIGADIPAVREKRLIRRQQYQAIVMGSHGGLQIESGLAVTFGKQAAEVAVSVSVLNQTEEPESIRSYFGTNDRSEIFLGAGGEKRPQTVEIIDIGQGQSAITHLPGLSAQTPGAGGTLHQREMRMEAEANHAGRAATIGCCDPRYILSPPQRLRIVSKASLSRLFFCCRQSTTSKSDNCRTG